MKKTNISICKLCLIATMFAFNANAFAQDIPIDGGLGGNGTWPGTSWAGDTIISNTPIGGIAGSGNHAPSITQNVCAIYNCGYIFIMANTDACIPYAVRNEDQHTVLRGQFTASAAVPALIDVTSLPSGHYTLLLYLNNECLEGEFEKN